MAPGTVSDVAGDRNPVAGEVLVSIDATSPCGTGIAGCGGPRNVAYNGATGVATIQGGRIWIDPVAVGYSTANKDHVAAHEFGHAMGLHHFDGYYNGQLQVMNGTSAGYVSAGTYRAGDRNGFAFLHAGGRPWASLGGTITSDPDAASWGSGRLDVFAKGTNNAVWKKTYQNNWYGWGDEGGQIVGSPTAVSWGPGRIDLFGRGTDNALWHKYWNGTSWSPWVSLGGVLTSDPEVASWAPGRLDVFARGTNNAMFHKYYANVWSGWADLGGKLVGGPTAVSWGPGRIDVFSRGTDNALWHKYWDGTRW